MKLSIQRPFSTKSKFKNPQSSIVNHSRRSPHHLALPAGNAHSAGIFVNAGTLALGGAGPTGILRGTLTIDSGASGTISNTASITEFGGIADLDSGNDSATDETRVADVEGGGHE